MKLLETPPTVKGPVAPAISPPRRSLPTRWGEWMARRRWWVLGAWGAAVVASAVLYPHLMSSLVAPDYSVTGSDSARVSQLLETNFSAAGAEQDVIVFDSDTLTIKDAAYRDTVDRVVAAARNEPWVASVLGPADPGAAGQVSVDGHAALASVGLNGNDRQRGGRASDLQDAVAAAAGTGPVHAYLTGYSPSANDLTEVENADVERAESVGIPIAFIVLVVALGTVIGGFVPLITAVVSLMATFGVLSALTTVKSFDSFLLSIVTMIGVGISIDYSLFVLSRYREELVKAKRKGRPNPVQHAVGKAMATSGRTILFSGTIVMISMLSLYLVDSPLFHGMAVGAALVVIATLLTAWTMLPALLAALGPRVNKWALPRRWRPAEGFEDSRPSSSKPSGWARWAHMVLAHPWLAAPAAALLILFALPTFGIKLGIDLGMSAVSDMPTGKAQLILNESFSPGAMSPIQILASHQGTGSLSQDDLTTIDKLTTSISKDPRVSGAYSIATLLKQTEGEVSPQALARLEKDQTMATVLAQTVNTANGSNRTVVTAVPRAPVDSTEATNLVKDLRNDVIPSYSTSKSPEMLVGGETAQFTDLASETLAKLPWVMVLVLSLSFLYLLLIFRSLLIPAKAVLMNLIATGAAFGLTTWVFQGGHLEGLFGFASVGFVQVYLPIMVFAVLFGLSMDYEVFLMGRVQEQWLRTHDNDDAVATGIAHTARAITAAACIMAAVFGCFLVADILELKEFGFALAIAVVLDATLVRLLLVPAVMKLAGGKANWWVPRFLDRILPRIALD